MAIAPEDIPGKIRWLRNRAEEIRTAAEGMQDQGARQVMLRLSRTYEKMADDLEKAVNDLAEGKTA